MERIVKGIWIPLEIWQDSELCWNEKILLMEIDSFTAAGKECYISNEYIADLLNVKERMARGYLSHLIEAGYVNVVRFDGRKRYIESAIHCQAEWQKIAMQSGNNLPHTDINIPNTFTYDNTLSKGRTKPFVKPTLEEVKEYCRSRNNNVDPERFYDFYESNGWKVGKNPMRDWKAAVRTWEKREKEIAPRKREKKESVFEHNLKVVDQLFGTNHHETYYGRRDTDEQ